jgi:flagellar secretion chaperone FliS
MKNPALAYRQLSVQGATPLGLVVMLYDGAIAAMHRAAAALEDQNIPGKCAHLNRALAIVAQLEGTLNFARGGEVAQTLKALYVYSRTQLQKANIENSAEILRALIDKLSSVREAWYEADRQPPPAPTAPTGADAAGDVPPAAKSRLPAYASVPVGEGSPYSSQSAPEPGSWRVSA